MVRDVRPLPRSGPVSRLKHKRIPWQRCWPTRPSSFLPFPTYAADEESFDPAGYWRGPVWIDQAYFAIGGLYQNGFTVQADSMLTKLLGRLRGLATVNH